MKIQTTHRITDAPGGFVTDHKCGVLSRLGSILQLVILNGFYELMLAEWTQIRYLQAAPLSALKESDPHNWSTKG
jgi:hypothetical protein